MERYKKAVEEISKIPQLGSVKNELSFWLSCPDDPQAGIHFLKVARECLFEWSKEDSFYDKVSAACKTVNYDELDMFQKAIYHILSTSPIKDGKFDISEMRFDWDDDPKSWQHKIFDC